MRYKNIIDFYMISNNLKEIKSPDGDSTANHIYNAIILAIAINSEYDNSNKLGVIIEDILLKSLIKYNLDKVNRHFSTLEFDEYSSDKYKKLKKHMNLLHKVDTRYSPYMDENALFALEALRIENILSNCKDRYNLSFKTIDKAYNDFGPDYEFIESGLDQDKNDNIINFYHLNKELTRKVRSGWDDTHWNIKGNREKIAEHVVGTIGLAISFDMYGNFDIDINKVITMLALHEIGEIIIGDITPFDNISKEEKRKIEHEAMKRILSNLRNKDELFNLLLEFDEDESKEAKFARYCDKLEADIQAKVYYEKGLHHDLDDQANNVVFKNEKAREMLKNGAKNPFEIWYIWDKPIYREDGTFAKTLEYVNKNNINN